MRFTINLATRTYINHRLVNSIFAIVVIISRKTSDWIGLLDQLEKATPEGIALTSFAPDSKNGEIKIEGETRTFAKVRTYLEKLEESKAFRNVQLLSHQETAATDKGRIVKFAVSFQAVTQ